VSEKKACGRRLLRPVPINFSQAEGQGGGAPGWSGAIEEKGHNNAII
jgi:hypothetical protein